jgi:glycosyltransferase involved in cell wall biosynthesis
VLRCVYYLPRVRLEAGGVTRAALDLCRILASLGHSVTLATSDAADVPAEWRDADAAVTTDWPHVPRIALVPPPRGPLLRLPRSARAVLARILGDADVLHLHEPWTASNLQWAAAARHARVPYVLSVHGMLDDWSMAQKCLKKRLYLALAANRLLAGAARVHCTARAELDQARRWLPRDNGVVLPLVVDLSDYVTPPGPDLARDRFPAARARAGPTLLFLSRVHPKKGVDLLIRAAAELRRRGRPCTVLVAGPGEPGYVRSLEQLARDEGVCESVHFLGMSNGAEKVSLYQAADALVLPTSQENFGLVLVEALACGTPVVTTRGVDIWQELQEAGAQIAEERTPAAIATAVESILGRPDAKAIGERGRRWVFDKLDPARVAAQYASLYESLTRRGTPSP